MKPITLVVSFFVATVLQIANAEQPADGQQQAKTKLEQFQAKTGSVIIMGIGPVGNIQAEAGAGVEIEVREFTDAASGAKQSGVVIKVSEAGDRMRGVSSYVDFDEVESLIKGVDYISGLNKGVTKLPAFQADYRTRGDVDISTFTTKGNEMSAAIKVGSFSSATAFITLAELSQFRKLLQSSLTALQAIKGQ
ncbi:MAG: hypothetical protein P4L99_23905 [Chthoniobacter sp.]|nr:hypothetical protein [Chthoniobacter sp.]